MLTQPAQAAIQKEQLPEQEPKQLNRADAYHALKDQLLPLLYSQTPAEQVIEQLQRLFLARPLSVPPDRKVPRRKPSFHRSYHFQRRVRKIFLTHAQCLAHPPLVRKPTGPESRSMPQATIAPSDTVR